MLALSSDGWADRYNYLKIKVICTLNSISCNVILCIYYIANIFITYIVTVTEVAKMTYYLKIKSTMIDSSVTHTKILLIGTFCEINEK